MGRGCSVRCKGLACGVCMLGAVLLRACSRDLRRPSSFRCERVIALDRRWSPSSIDEGTGLGRSSRGGLVPLMMAIRGDWSMRRERSNAGRPTAFCARRISLVSVSNDHRVRAVGKPSDVGNDVADHNRSHLTRESRGRRMAAIARRGQSR